MTQLKNNLMANEVPTIPVTERTSVPVTALFDAAELTLPPAAPPTEPNSPLPETTPKTETPKTETPEKIKIGDKEYTKAELEAKLAERSAPAAVPAPAVPAAEPVKPPTPEEIAAAEGKWVEGFLSQEKISVPFTEKEMETILAGDKDGIALLSSKLNGVLAKAVMLARKSIYADLNPVIGGLQANLQPVVQNAAQVEAATAEHEFFSMYPDFKAHTDTVRRVGEALLTRFPNECKAMTRQALMAEVAAQADRIIQDECSRFAPGKNWRELQKAAPAPAPAPAPAAPAPAKIPAPAANSPAAIPAAGITKDWHKGTAASLAN